jgi:hypothetical protein
LNAIEMYDIIKSNAEKCSFFRVPKKILEKSKKFPKPCNQTENLLCI